MAFNLQGALQAASALPGAASQHVCAKYVRTYLEHGGIDTSGRPGLARQYTTYLPTIGFSHIATVSEAGAQDQFTQNVARPGDIAVYTKPGAPSQPGHICMWTGSQWVSDFRQRRMSVYSSNVQAHIFRYTGVIDNHPVELNSDVANTSTAVGGITELNAETLAACCPEHVNFKGLWMRYQLRAGLHTKTMSQFAGSAGYALPDGTGSVSSAPGDVLDRALTVARKLVSMGMQPIHAAGIVGVFMDENGCNPKLYCKAEAAGRGAKGTGGFGYGAGIGSWTGEAYKNKLLALVGLPPNTPIESLDLNKQAEILMADIKQGPMSKYYKKLQTAPDITTASASAVVITGGPGYGKWAGPYCSAADAKHVSDVYGASNDKRFGRSPNHWNLDVRRLEYAKQVLSQLS